MERVYDFEKLKAKMVMGDSLTPEEAVALTEHLSMQKMASRSFDFAEIEERQGAGIERNALCARNAEWASHRPKQPAERKPFFADDLPNAPTSIIPCGPAFDGRRGIERMLEKFKAKLAEIREMGRLS